jgi:hypothetical protein
MADQPGDGFAEHVFAVNANIMVFTELRDLVIDALALLTNTPVDSLSAQENELIAECRGVACQDLASLNHFVGVKIPAQVGAICRLPERDHPDFVRDADAAALYFRQASFLYEILSGCKRLDTELRRHGLPTLYD